jgi:SAM-dependent methyltransferase
MVMALLKKAGIAPGSIKNVAEIGCGAGGLIKFLGDELPAAVQGFELDPTACRYGNERGVRISNAEFVGTEGPYDLILLEQALEHMATPDEILGRIAHAQRVGGLLYIGVPGLLNMHEHYEGNFIAYLEYVHLYHYCLYTLERLLAKSGYRLVHGDETISAVFQRTDEKIELKTPVVTADFVRDYLATHERSFARRGSLLMRGYKSYAKYLLFGLYGYASQWMGRRSA